MVFLLYDASLRIHDVLRFQWENQNYVWDNGWQFESVCICEFYRLQQLLNLYWLIRESINNTQESIDYNQRVLNYLMSIVSHNDFLFSSSMGHLIIQSTLNNLSLLVNKTYHSDYFVWVFRRQRLFYVDLNWLEDVPME